MKIEVTKNKKDGNRHFIKNQILEVMPWKAKEMIAKKWGKIPGQDIETTMKSEDIEKR